MTKESNNRSYDGLVRLERELDTADAILIVAPGYTEEIASIIRERFGKQVEILALKSNHMETLR